VFEARTGEGLAEVQLGRIVGSNDGCSDRHQNEGAEHDEAKEGFPVSEQFSDGLDVPVADRPGQRARFDR
jgi:hypothetical protein